MTFFGRLTVLLLSWCLSVEFSSPHGHDSTDRARFQSGSSMPSVGFGQKDGLMGQVPLTPPEELDASYWMDSARKTLDMNLRLEPNKNRAKNVILFMGDGMSMPTVAAARILKGQLNNKPGEETRLVFEDFPSVGLAKTYCTDSQVADSACSSTAYHCGVKGAYYTVGLNGRARRGDCRAAINESNHVTSINQWAQDAGKWTGSVTTTRITHASPSGGYAHSADREWETDSAIPAGCSAKDIAHQLVYNAPGKDMRVLLGGGRKHFLTNATDFNGTRTDGQNLITKWKEGKAGQKATYVQDRAGLMAINPAETDYLLGLFRMDHMSYYVDADHTEEPSLEEMTEKAIQILERNPEGFFLFVEGGKIDLAHHDNLAHKALVETIEFEKAVVKALKMTSVEDTLVVVTSDHSHSFTMNGYPKRGNSIFGFSDELSDLDWKPYSTLSYANGPAKTKYEDPVAHTRYNLTNDDTANPQYEFSAMVPMVWETHGGDDIGVYAVGPWAHLLDRQFEQNYIAIVMAHAASILPSDTSSSTSSLQLSLFSVVFGSIFVFLSVMIS
nr:PREDICTED: alkaline phosphatase-like [Bemisia tabaci]